MISCNLDEIISVEIRKFGSNFKAFQRCSKPKIPIGHFQVLIILLRSFQRTILIKNVSGTSPESCNRMKF
jgi:hypothetical protein